MVNFKNDDIITCDDKLIFNPYNPVNKEITLSDIQCILEKYGIPFPVHNLELYKRAFVHRSYTKRPMLENERQNICIVEKPHNCISLKTKCNERLEFLGDGVLELVTKYNLYRRFPKENEGFMTEKKIALVKNEAIGKMAYDMGIHRHYIISKHAEEKNTRTNLKKLGCLFEAFIGALFLDYNKIDVLDDDAWFKNVFVTGPGFQMAQKFIENVFEQHVDWEELIDNDDNYKNILQVKIQKEFKVTPHYLEIENTPEEGYRMGVYICLGQPIFQVEPSDAISMASLGSFKAIHDYVEANGKVLVFMEEGRHKIKRKAEQMACKKSIDNMD
jgi:dsRNA-specific ribonuclease|uniref:RNase III domain-containing protein n=1 Tax=viral metagenome TaxID=1070528 RepID=A0A6C0LVA0_9ZZZZ